MELLHDPLLRVSSPTEVTWAHRPRTGARIVLTLLYLVGVSLGLVLLVAGVSGYATGDVDKGAFCMGFGMLFFVSCGVVLHALRQSRRFVLESVQVGGPERVLRFVERTPAGPRVAELPLGLFDRAFVQPLVHRSRSDGQEQVSRSYGLSLAGPQIVWRIARFDRLDHARESLAALQPLVRYAPNPSWSPAAPELEVWNDADGLHVRWSQQPRTAPLVAFAANALAFALCMVPAYATRPTFVGIVWGLAVLVCMVVVIALRRTTSRVQVSLGAQEIVVHETRPAGVSTKRTARTEPLDTLLRVTDSATLTLANRAYIESIFRVEVEGALNPLAALGALELLANPTQQRPVTLVLSHSTPATMIAAWHRLR